MKNLSEDESTEVKKCSDRIMSMAMVATIAEKFKDIKQVPKDLAILLGYCKNEMIKANNTANLIVSNIRANDTLDTFESCKKTYLEDSKDSRIQRFTKDWEIIIAHNIVEEDWYGKEESFETMIKNISKIFNEKHNGDLKC